MEDRLGLSSIDLATEYRTGQSDPVSDFYRPCLINAQEYKRAVGFSLSVNNFSGCGSVCVALARAGGRTRLICSPALTAEDVTSINSGSQARTLEHALIREIERMLADEANFLSDPDTRYAHR